MASANRIDPTLISALVGVPTLANGVPNAVVPARISRVGSALPLMVTELPIEFSKTMEEGSISNGSPFD